MKHPPRPRRPAAVAIALVAILIVAFESPGATAPATKVRFDAFPEAANIVGGEDVQLYLSVRNESDRPWEPIVLAHGVFLGLPEDLLEVYRDGAKLPRAPRHVDPGQAPEPTICLRPGEKLLLPIRLSMLVAVDRGSRYGQYEVRVHPGLFRGGYGTKQFAFKWSAAPDAGRNDAADDDDLPSRLRHADWANEAARFAREGGWDQLLRLTSEADQEPLVRTRAVTTLATTRIGPDEVVPQFLYTLAITIDDVGGVALADVAAERQDIGGLLLTLLKHRNLGVRRAAAAGLIRTEADFNYMQFQMFFDARERECDGVIRRDLELAIIKAARKLPPATLPPNVVGGLEPATRPSTSPVHGDEDRRAR